MSSAQSEQTNSVAVAIIAAFGILLVNGGAVFLIVRTTQDSMAFLVASIIVSVAAVLVDITAVRMLIAARLRRARAARRAREKAASSGASSVSSAAPSSKA